MSHDEIPTDDQVLDVLRQTAKGLTPTELLEVLQREHHSRANIIRAIQRVFDRGLVDLSDGARLVEAKVRVAA